MNLEYMKVSLFEISKKTFFELFHDILIFGDAPVYVYVCICICVCVYIYIYIYIYIY